MNCKHLKQDLPLLVGQDLEPDAEMALRRHIATCPECRIQWQKLRVSADVLREAASVAPVVLDRSSGASGRTSTDWPPRSSWPDIQARLVVRERASENRMAGWFPVSVMAAACALLAFVSSSTPVFDFDRHDAPYASLTENWEIPADWSEIPRREPRSSLPVVPVSDWQRDWQGASNHEFLQQLHWDHRSW